MIAQEFVGIIPASGLAERLGSIPCSKEILPIKIHNSDQIKVISEELIHQLKIAKIAKIHIIIRKGKWDIPDYYGDGKDWGMDISYHIMRYPYGVPFTIDQAYSFIKDKYVALGFPDMFIEPLNSILKLKEKIISTGADLVLGLYPIENQLKWDMVEFDGDNVTKIIVKPKKAQWEYGWSNIIWSPKFTELLHTIVQNGIENEKNRFIKDGDTVRELYPGDIIQAAIDRGMVVKACFFKEGKCTDIGTIDDLKKFYKKD